jgi:Protein of unknown function (DUF2808)
MKGLICGGLSALLLTATTTATMAAPVRHGQLEIQTQSQMAFKTSVPFITSSGVQNDTYFIKVAVTGMSVQDLMISLPNQMKQVDQVRVLDKSGKEIPAKIDISEERVSIVFAQPVAPGNSLEVNFTGISTTDLLGSTLLYGVTAQRVGLMGEIPIGTARIYVPGAD